MNDDPLRQLGLGPDATPDEIRAARRRLAKEHHPDTGGDAGRMQAVNDATAAALRDAALGAGPVDVSAAEPDPTAAQPTGGTGRQGPTPTGAQPIDGSGTARDAPSFTVEALPAETFEALLVVTTWFGEVVDDDPPYRLDTLLTEPLPCWCRLELVPEAGASTVSLTLAAADGRALPRVEDVRDLWVGHLNQYDWPAP